MAKLTKFQRSQKAHSRLCNKYHNQPVSANSLTKGNYHTTVYNIQRNRGSILGKDERKKIFKIHHDYKFKRDKSSIKAYLDLDNYK